MWILGINLGLPWWLSSKESNAGSTPGSEDPLEEGMALLQYSCLENPMDRGVWRAIVHWVTRVGQN